MIIERLTKWFKASYNISISKYAAKFLKEGDKVLDIGSGTGFVAEQIQKDHKVFIEGVDIHSSNLASIPYKVFDGKKLPYSNKYFDKILLVYVLHHCRDPKNLLREAKRVCKESGKIIIFEDTYKNIFEKLLTRIHGLFFNKLFCINNNASFSTKKEWIKKFMELELNLVYSSYINKQISYPVSHIMFVLKPLK